MKKDRVTITCAGCEVQFEVPRSKSAQRHCSRSCRSDLMRKIDKGGPNGCWLWLGTKDGQLGYGRVRFRGKQMGSHRAVYLTLKGSIPDGMDLDHLCRNPPCCNPDHLEPVTRRENLARAPSIIYARTGERCKNGHIWTPQSTYWHPSQNCRVCRTCTYESIERYLARKSAREVPTLGVGFE